VINYGCFAKELKYSIFYILLLIIVSILLFIFNKEENRKEEFMKIEIKNVSKKFKDINALENVSMTLESGKIYGFVGHNGSGKTVLLKLICAFLEPSTGEILFDGVNVIKENSFPPSTRALIERPNF